jgi:hypothetical protein
MKKLVANTILLFFSMTIYSQQIDFGRYRLCYDMYWKCHFQNLIELKPDSTYEFIYLDDTQMKKTHGKWKIEPAFLVLTPDLIPDTIQVTDIFETTNKTRLKNIISINENFKSISGLEINIFQSGEELTFPSDSLGEIQYTGQVADSVTFSIKGRELRVIPKNKVTPSMIRITIDSNYRDLVYQQLGMNKIVIQNDKMLIKYRDGENGELKTEYFEKIK